MMGLWDFVILIILAVIPLLFIWMAVSDWRRFGRRRYLVLAAAYLLFGSGPLLSFINADNSPVLCLSGILAIVVIALVHASFRRSDKPKPVPPPQDEAQG